MKKDKYKIPLEEAQAWCKNWINLKEKEAGMAEEDKHQTKDMRAFLVAKEDLLELFEQVEDANYVRFYIGLKEEDGQNKKIPHLLMVNAKGDSPATAKDIVGKQPTAMGDSDGDDAPVNDFSHPCPKMCDGGSPLYVL